MKPTHRSSLRRAAAVIAVALAAGGLALVQPARAITPTETSRLEGADRYETAVAVANDTFPEGADNVILATGEDFADALASSGMAGALDAPVLLTLSDRLLDVTEQGLTDLAPETVYLMGGEAALSASIEQELVDAGYTVERVAGDTRFGTAAAAGQIIADQAAPVTGDGGIGETSNGVTAFVTNGLKFPDAVSTSPVAYAGNLPILLTATDVIPQVTLDAIESLGIEHVVLVGGTGVISSAVHQRIEDETGVSIQRLAGADRWETNLDVVEFGRDETEIGGETVYLSTGAKFADALVGGPAAGQNLNRLLLVHPTTLPDVTETYILDNGANIDELIAIGGTAAVSKAVLDDAAAAAKLDSNQVFEVSPGTAQQSPSSSSALNNDGRQAFTATGLQSGTEYVIAVLDSAVVGEDADNNVTLSTYRLAQGDSTAIETVNGDQVSSGGPAGSGTEDLQVTATADANGAIAFTVDATDPDSVVPFVYRDEDGDGVLDTVDDQPAEPFGRGGLTEWFGEEAASGNYTGNPTVPGDEPDRLRATFVSRAGNYFATSEGTFFYASGDVLLARKASGTEEKVSLDQFEAMLTVNDQMSIQYHPDSQSQFVVYEDVMSDMSELTATAVRVSGSDDDVVQLTWEPTDQPDTLYDIYRDTNRNGTLDESTDIAVLVDQTGPQVEVTHLSNGPESIRFIVVPKGGFTKREDRPGPYNRLDEDPSLDDNFATGNVAVGRAAGGAPRLLTNGATVSFNAGISAASSGDEWMLHFTHPVTVTPNASITVGGQTFDNGTSESAWTVSGNTVLITLGSAASTMNFSYSGGTGAEIAAVNGVRGLGGSVVTDISQDTKLEHNGPELMVDSSTCQAGPSTPECTIAFNEPVDETSAETRANYSYPVSNTSSLRSITLHPDGRTVTLTIDGDLTSGAQIAPSVAEADGRSGVEDDDTDEQSSIQPLFDFVYG